MSLEGIAATRGSLLTVKRRQRTRQADSSYRQAWTATATEVGAALQDVTSALSQELWGQEAEATLRAVLPLETDIQLGDGVLVTEGPHAGEAYQVVGVEDRSLSVGPQHRDVGLARTKETFS